MILTRGNVLYVPIAELRSESPNQDSESESPDQDSEIETPLLSTVERDHILRVLRECRGRIGGPEGAAARLGIKRTTLNSRLSKLGIARSEYS